MTPEIEKAMQDLTTASHEYNKAEQDFKNIKDQLVYENLDYVKAQQKIDKLNKQREWLKAKENKLGAQVVIEQQKIRKIIETLENNCDYKTAYNHLISTRGQRNDARTHVWQLLAKEAENDTTRR